VAEEALQQQFALQLLLFVLFLLLQALFQFVQAPAVLLTALLLQMRVLLVLLPQSPPALVVRGYC